MEIVLGLVFCNNAYFRQRSAQKWVYFSVFVQFNITTISSFKPPSSTGGGENRHMPSQTFLYEVRCRKAFIGRFFGIIRIFGRFSPKVNLLSPFFNTTTCLNSKYTGTSAMFVHVVWQNYETPESNNLVCIQLCWRYSEAGPANPPGPHGIYTNWEMKKEKWGKIELNTKFIALISILFKYQSYWKMFRIRLLLPPPPSICTKLTSNVPVFVWVLSIDIYKEPRYPTSYTTHVKIRSGS